MLTVFTQYTKKQKQLSLSCFFNLFLYFFADRYERNSWILKKFIILWHESLTVLDVIMWTPVSSCCDRGRRSACISLYYKVLPYFHFFLSKFHKYRRKPLKTATKSILHPHTVFKNCMSDRPLIKTSYDIWKV